MADVRKMYEGLGFSSVKSYIQSGNLLFRSDETDAVKLAEMISAEIQTHFGFDVPVIVKSVDEVAKTLAASPFLNVEDDLRDKRVMVGFVQGEISAEKQAAYTPPNNEPAEMQIINNAFHLYYPSGQARTKLTINYLERKLDVTTTTRNLRSINKLLALAEALP